MIQLLETTLFKEFENSFDLEMFAVEKDGF
jgi:hypothetical protein